MPKTSKRTDNTKERVDDRNYRAEEKKLKITGKTLFQGVKKKKKKIANLRVTEKLSEQIII